MKITDLSRLMLVIFFSAGIVGAAYYFLAAPKIAPEKTITATPDRLFGWQFPVARFPSTGPGDSVTYSNIRDPGGIPQGLPVRLRIPGINVDTAIEDARITSDGRMDVPAGSINVAWFALGPHPGDEGSAVIGGHFGIDNGVPKVFFNLNKLKAGDKVYIEDDRGDIITFEVKSIKLFDRDADATTVFTSNDSLSHLNLITCEGVWNQVNDSYPQRLVVFTEKIKPAVAGTTDPTPSPAPAPSPVPPPGPTPTPAPSPSPVPPPVPRVIPESPPVPSPAPAPSPTPPGQINNPPAQPSPTPVQMLAQYITSMFGSPMDSTISSLLILSIIFIAIKIIWR
jgi:LPXTG-site transpeptidase (sortase) family protein